MPKRGSIRMKLFTKITAFLCLTPFFTGCDYNNPGAYDARAGFNAFVAQKEAAKAEKAKGPQKSAAELALEAAKTSYTTYCASCHGADGAANSPTAMALNPKPRNFTDKAWQKSVDDSRITKVIKEGGAAVGLSATMAPWGAVLSDDDIKGLVSYVRKFGE